MADFTPTQGRCLAFIRAYANRHGCPPAESAVAAAMCPSAASVSRAVNPGGNLVIRDKHFDRP